MEKRSKQMTKVRKVIVSRQVAEATAKNERVPISVPTICTAAEQPAHLARHVSFSGEIEGSTSK